MKALIKNGSYGKSQMKEFWQEMAEFDEQMKPFDAKWKFWKK
jgi:hypothetical protein